MQYSKAFTAKVRSLHDYAVICCNEDHIWLSLHYCLCGDYILDNGVMWGCRLHCPGKWIFFIHSVATSWISSFILIIYIKKSFMMVWYVIKYIASLSNCFIKFNYAFCLKVWILMIFSSNSLIDLHNKFICSRISYC